MHANEEKKTQGKLEPVTAHDSSSSSSRSSLFYAMFLLSIKIQFDNIKTIDWITAICKCWLLLRLYAAVQWMPWTSLWGRGAKYCYRYYFFLSPMTTDGCSINIVAMVFTAATCTAQCTIKWRAFIWRQWKWNFGAAFFLHILKKYNCIPKGPNNVPWFSH